MELIVVIAIMAILTVVLAPALLGYVERSRANKDVKAMDEVVNSVRLVLSNQETYDEMLEHSVLDNASCYVDSSSENGYINKVILKAATSDLAEQYSFDEDARKADETIYYAAGNMRGVTITFSPDKTYKSGTYEISSGIINQFVGRKTGYVSENVNLYSRVRATVGETITLTSQTYRNSDFTVFIQLGSQGGMDASEQEMVNVYGWFNGTNLEQDATKQYKLTSDRVVGNAGQYDLTVNDYLNDEENADISFRIEHGLILGNSIAEIQDVKMGRIYDASFYFV